MSPALYLIPSGLGGTDMTSILPEETLNVIRSLTCFIVEDEKSARAFLKGCRITIPQADLRISVLDKHDDQQDILPFLNPLKDGHSIGLLSEAGCPAVADPGARVVSSAHRSGIRVVPLIGPSSLLLALMASGLEGQRFCFHGYLPIDKSERSKKIVRLEESAIARKETQLFIEAPYRNNALLADLLQHLHGETRLCIAADLTMPAQLIRTLKVKEWKKQVPDLHKRPAVFLIGA